MYQKFMFIYTSNSFQMVGQRMIFSTCGKQLILYKLCQISIFHDLLSKNILVTIVTSKQIQVKMKYLFSSSTALQLDSSNLDIQSQVLLGRATTVSSAFRLDKQYRNIQISRYAIDIIMQPKSAGYLDSFKSRLDYKKAIYRSPWTSKGYAFALLLRSYVVKAQTHTSWTSMGSDIGPFCRPIQI